MMEESYLWVGTVVAGWLLVEVIKFIQIHKTRPLFDNEDKTRLLDLYNMHKKTDADGRPLWYIPHDLHDNQMHVIRKIQSINTTLLQMQKNQERILLIQEETARLQRDTAVALAKLERHLK